MDTSIKRKRILDNILNIEKLIKEVDAISFQELIVPCLIVFVLTAAVTSFIFLMIDKKKIANGTSKVKLAEKEAERRKEKTIAASRRRYYLQNPWKQ